MSGLDHGVAADVPQRCDVSRAADDDGGYKTRSRPRPWLAALLLLLAGAAGAQAPVLNVSSSDSADGTVVLDWGLAEGALVQVQRAEAAGFAAPLQVYRGGDSASVITGLPDGDYFFRARAEHPDGSLSAWSEPVTVSVRHHSLARAFTFFGLGAVVFLSTLALILSGTRRNRGDRHG